MKKITTAARDLATALVVTAVAFALFVYFELFEDLDGWLRRYEVLEFDELILLPFVLAVLLGVYYWRERKEFEREMAQRERIGEDLRRSEAGLVAAQRIARVGNLEYDFGKDEARWSDEMYRIFGFEPVVRPDVQDVFGFRGHLPRRPLLLVEDRASRRP